MSNFGLSCDVCNRENVGITWVNGMKFCAKCYQETFGNNTSKFVDLLNTEMYELKISNLEHKLEEKDQRIAELEEQLKNAIMLLIEIGDKCWTINCWCEYGDAKKGEPYTVTRYGLHENIVSGYDIYKSMINNNLTLNVVPRAETNYNGVQPYLFATKEEAEAKLKELGEKNDWQGTIGRVD